MSLQPPKQCRAVAGKPRGKLNHGPCATMLLNLLVAKRKNNIKSLRWGHTKSAVLMLPLRFLFLHQPRVAAPGCETLLLEVLLLPSLGSSMVGG